MMSATSNPARSAGGHYMEGRGYGLIVFASVLLSSRGEPGVVVGYERNTVTIAKVAKAIPVRGFRTGRGPWRPPSYVLPLLAIPSDSGRAS
ncbi:MAG: hypothetical protein ACLQK8_30875 [Streptosporangiaceae bacterium]